MFAENTYVISESNGDCAVIDPGCFHSHERKTLSDYIDANGLKVRYVLNTHLHIDHVIGNRFVVERYRVPLIAHAKDVYNLERAAEFARLWNLPDPDSPMPDTWVDEGHTLDLGETTLQVLFTPGHCAGHISFLDAKGGNLFSGDVIFQNSIGRTDLPGGDHSTLLQTIREKVMTLPDETRIYAGHMGVTNVGRERQFNPFLNG